MALDQIDVDEYFAEQEKAAKGQQKEMSFFEHLEELRWHLVRSAAAVGVLAIVLFGAKDFVFNRIILGPKSPDFVSYRLVCQLSEAIGMGDALCFGPKPFDLVAIEMGELFLMHLSVSVVLGVVLAFPYVFFELWRFISPGLYARERRATRYVVLVCSFLFATGVLFGYFVISPFAVTFLTGYEVGSVLAQPRLSSFVNYMIMFTVPTGVVFELPIVVYFLSRFGLVTAAQMRQYRRHAFVAILVLAAIITPPDVVTQALVGLPLYVLYELSIGIATRVEKQRRAAEAAA